MLDVKQILDKFSIQYVTHHQKVSKDAVGICCPYCGDTNYKRGIFLDNGVSTCWSCHKNIPLHTLLYDIAGVPFKQYKALVGFNKVYEGDSLSVLDSIFNKKVEKDERINGIDYWNLHKKHFRHTDDLSARNKTANAAINRFLATRNFEEKHLTRFDCHFALSGEYQQRLILPVVEGEEIVSFVAYDINRRSENKYMFPSMNIHNYVYDTGMFYMGYNGSFYDKTNLIITEGVFDAWVGGELGRTFCLFGKAITNAQLLIITALEPDKNKNIIICLDGDTLLKEKSCIANKLRLYYNNVMITDFPKKDDPASLGLYELGRIINQQFNQKWRWQ